MVILAVQADCLCAGFKCGLKFTPRRAAGSVRYAAHARASGARGVRRHGGHAAVGERTLWRPRIAASRRAAGQLAAQCSMCVRVTARIALANTAVVPVVEGRSAAAVNDRDSRRLSLNVEHSVWETIRLGGGGGDATTRKAVQRRCHLAEEAARV